MIWTEWEIFTYIKGKIVAKMKKVGGTFSLPCKKQRAGIIGTRGWN